MPVKAKIALFIAFLWFVIGLGTALDKIPPFSKWMSVALCVIVILGMLADYFGLMAEHYEKKLQDLEKSQKG